MLNEDEPVDSETVEEPPKQRAMILAPRDTDLALAREPEVVLQEAARAAAALKKVLDAKPHKLIFKREGGREEQYLENEDWQTVAKFYGIHPRIDRTNYVSYETAPGVFVRGFESFASAVHVATGKVVATGEAACLDDEEKWGSRPKYAWHYHTTDGKIVPEDPGRDRIVWEKYKKQDGSEGNRPKKERVRVGDEKIPLFQLRSMAQTRSSSKAIRNAMGWVVVLAGYRPTPAEELPVEEVPNTPQAPAAAPAAAEKPKKGRGKAAAPAAEDQSQEQPAKEQEDPKDVDARFLAEYEAAAARAKTFEGLATVSFALWQAYAEAGRTGDPKTSEAFWKIKRKHTKRLLIPAGDYPGYTPLLPIPATEEIVDHYAAEFLGLDETAGKGRPALAAFFKAMKRRLPESVHAAFEEHATKLATELKFTRTAEGG